MAIKKISVNTSVKPFALTGLYFKVMQASGEVKAEFQLVNGDMYETGLSAGQGIEFKQKYKSIRISSDTEQQIVIWSGLGQLTQDSQSSTVIAGSSSINALAVTLKVKTAKQVLPAHMGRRSALIQAYEPFYVGGAGVSLDSGMPVEESITLDTQGEIWIISETAQELRILEEFN